MGSATLSHPRFKPETAHNFAKSVFIANGVPADNAEIVARCLVAADLRGVDTHGINRVPSYIARVRAGMLDPKATPTLEMKTPVVGQVDGKNAFGALSATLAIDTAIKSAEKFGIGMVSVAHSNHYGMAAWIVQRGIDAGMMSLVFTNSSRAMPAWGGKEKLLGTSPLACGAPAGKAPPFILDMAPTVAARGKVYKAKRRGEKIPLDWALDADGAQTDDPARALEGVMLPMGGPKGSGLAIMMDVFSGVLSGSAFAGGVAGPYETNRPADVGHFIIAIKPDLFLDLEEFKSRMDFLYQKVVSSEKMVGVDRVFFPGEIEQLHEAERRKLGIPFAVAEVELMNEEATRAGVAPLQSDA